MRQLEGSELLATYVAEMSHRHLLSHQCRHIQPTRSISITFEATAPGRWYESGRLCALAEVENNSSLVD